MQDLSTRTIRLHVLLIIVTLLIKEIMEELAIGECFLILGLEMLWSMRKYNWLSLTLYQIVEIMENYCIIL